MSPRALALRYRCYKEAGEEELAQVFWLALKIHVLTRRLEKCK